MSSILRDTEEGTTVCTECGQEVQPGISEAAHKEWECGLGTQKPLSGQDNGSSALSAVSPGKGAIEKITQEMQRKSTDPAFTAKLAAMPPGLVMSQDHRYWFNGEGPRPSVTTILEVLSKPALVYWKGQEVARAIYRDSKAFFGQAWDVGEDQAIGWAMKKADEQRDRAAKLGSSIHLLADMQSRATETLSKGFQVSDEEKPYLRAWEAFTAFLEAQGASIVSSEHAVWGEGYAGTYDLILKMPDPKAHYKVPGDPSIDATDFEIQHELWLVDIKTSKGIYPEYALQLAAYGHAAGIILPNDPKLYPMPKIDRYAVLHLRPDAYPEHGYKLIEYPVTERDYFSFISALDLYEWRREDRFSKAALLNT
jgi:hypothetical protein